MSFLRKRPQLRLRYPCLLLFILMGLSGCGSAGSLTGDSSDRSTLSSTVTNEPSSLTQNLTLDPSLTDSSNHDANTGNNSALLVANAGVDRMVVAGDTVVLNASDSQWDQNQSVSLRWGQVSGLPITIENENDRLTTFQVPSDAPLSSTIVIELVVLQGVFFDSDRLTLSVATDATEPSDAALKTGIGLNPRSWNPTHVFEAFEKVAAAGPVGFVQVPFSWDALHGRTDYPTYRGHYDWLVEDDPATGKNQFEAYNLQRAFAFDFLIPGGDPGSLSVAAYDGLPRFENNTLADAFVAECLWIADYFAPDYLAIGVEINTYLEAVNSAERSAMQATLSRAFDLIRAQYPDMVVFCYFQYEGVKSRNLWNEITPFVSLSDVTAFSTYPSSPVASAPDGYSSTNLPDDYFGEIEDHLGIAKPVAFVEVGHPSRPTSLFPLGSEAEQLMFVDRFFQIVPANTSLALWTYLFDPDLSSVYPPTIADHFGAMGQLRTADDATRKPHWKAR